MPPIYTSQSHTQTIPRVLCLQFGKLLWEENTNCITKSPGLVWQYSRLIWQKLIQSLKQHSHLHHALEELWQRPTSQILKHTRVESHYGGLLPLQLQTILSVQLEHCTWKVWYETDSSSHFLKRIFKLSLSIYLHYCQSLYYSER